MNALPVSGHDRPHYVYRCYDAESRLLYVGCTFDPVSRLYGHEGSAWWWPEFARVRNTVYPDRRAALRRERRAIHGEMPRCNVKGRWLRGDDRPHWTAQDYVEFHHAILEAAEWGVGVHTTKLLKAVEAEANDRFDVLMPREWASRWSA